MLGVGVLEEVAGRAQVQRGADIVVRAEGREHGDVGRVRQCADLPQDGQAVGAGHLDVQQDEVGAVRGDGHQGGAAVADGDDLDAGMGGEDHPQAGAHQLFVVDDDHPRRAGVGRFRPVHGLVLHVEWLSGGPHCKRGSAGGGPGPGLCGVNGGIHVRSEGCPPAPAPPTGGSAVPEWVVSIAPAGQVVCLSRTVPGELSLTPPQIVVPMVTALAVHGRHCPDLRASPASHVRVPLFSELRHAACRAAPGMNLVRA